MTLPSRRFLLAGAGALAGCSILPKGNPPPQLFRLTVAPPASASGPALKGQLLVDTPFAPSALDTDRIALTRSATSFDYFGGVAWSDRAPLMVQSLLIESLELSGRTPAVARESLALRADWALKTDLLHFEARYGAPGAGAEASPEVRISFSAKLVRMADRIVIGQHMANAVQRASRNEVPAIVDALDEANHQIIQEIIAWVVATGSSATR